jgi:HAD superfamily hydrolase (TIGR01509 family)
MEGPTAILDIDGTLVDTNWHHATAWYRALREHGVTRELWRLHRHIGMGGDQMVAAVAGDEVEERLGDAIRETEAGHYMALIDEVAPLPGAVDLLRALRHEGRTTVLASSAKEQEVDRYLDLLDARELVDGWTTAADVEATKPEPDLLLSALERAGGGPAVLVGDTTWDCRAAARAGIPCVAVLTGGFSERDLLDAGAVRVLGSVSDLLPRPGEVLDGAHRFLPGRVG